MGHIVDKCTSQNVKEAFRNLKEKIQRRQDANSYESQSNRDPNMGIIRVPTRVRRMLMETFENLGWGDAEYFLQSLGNI